MYKAIIVNHVTKVHLTPILIFIVIEKRLLWYENKHVKN